MTPKATFTATTSLADTSIELDLSSASAGDVALLKVASDATAGRSEGTWSLSGVTSLWDVQSPAPSTTATTWVGLFAFVVPSPPGPVLLEFSATSSLGNMQVQALTYDPADVDDASPVVDHAFWAGTVGDVAVALPEVDTTGVDDAVFVGAAFRDRSAGHTYTGVTEQVDVANTSPDVSDQTRMSAATVTLGAGGLHGSSYTFVADEATTRQSLLSSVALRPAALASELPVPSGMSLTATVDTAEIVGSWGSVADAATYDYEVEEWDGVSWQPFALGSTTDPTTSFTLGAVDGVTFDTDYRARVRAVPA